MFLSRFAYFMVAPWAPFLMPGKLRHEKGQGLVEYALVLVLVAVVVIAILTLLGPQIGNVFSRITCGLDSTC